MLLHHRKIQYVGSHAGQRRIRELWSIYHLRHQSVDILIPVKMCFVFLYPQFWVCMRGKNLIEVQVTRHVVRSNKVLTSVIEFKLGEEGWRSTENIDKVIGLRQVSCGNPRNFIVLFYFLCYFPAAQSNRQ